MQSISDDDASIDTARISEYLDPKKKKKILTYDVSDDEDDDIGKIFSECTSCRNISLNVLQILSHRNM